MDKRHSPRRWATLAVAAALLAGCHSSPTRLYTLYGTPATGRPQTVAGPPVRVDAVHVPPAFDRIEVVSGSSGGVLTIDDLEHWSAPLDHMARQVISEDLTTRLAPGRVIFPHLAKPDGALGITVDILDLTTVGREAVMQASWAVTGRPAGTAVAPSAVELRTPAAAGGAGSARTLSLLLGQLADRMAGDL